MNTQQQLIKLLKTNQEKYYRVAFTYVKNKEDAMDIVHDAIVSALQKIDSLKKSEYLETWFYRILINKSISFLRKNKNTVYLDDLPAPQIPETEDADSDRNITLYTAIDHLSPQLKTIIILRFYADMKLDQIAQITSTKLSTVKARLYKALTLLKMDIEDIDYD